MRHFEADATWSRKTSNGLDRVFGERRTETCEHRLIGCETTAQAVAHLLDGIVFMTVQPAPGRT